MPGDHLIKNGLCKLHGSNSNERALLQTHVISKLNRRELEDQYYKVLDNNLGLKRKLNTQIEKYKLLNAKYIRLDEQRKINVCNKILQETVENQILHIYTLEESNKKLIEKINAFKNKIVSQKKIFVTDDRGKNINAKSKRSNNVTFREEVLQISNAKNDSEDKIRILEKENGELKEYIYNNRIEIHKNDKEPDNSNANESMLHLRIDESELDSNLYKSFKEASVQTEEEYKIDLLNQQLNEEQIKVFELESNVKYSKLSENVVKEFNNRLEMLRMKCINDDDLIVRKNDLETQNQDLRKRLENIQVERDSLETINKELISKILSIQSELDTLQLMINAKNESHKRGLETHFDTEIIQKTVSRECIVSDNIKKEINTPDVYNDMKNSSNVQNKSVNTSLEYDLVPNPMDLHVKSSENDRNIDIISDDDKRSSDEKSFDDGTYNVSLNDEANDNSLRISVDGYLSDGEVQKHCIKEQIPDSVIQSTINAKSHDTINERIDISARAESTLQSLSVEMEKSKTLMESLFNNNDKKANNKRNKRSSNVDNAQFILHIISAELTEATIAELKESSFFLSWQFYRNAFAYTPLTNSELFNFNYSSTCDLTMNQSLKDYFLNEKIVIDIHKRDVDTSLIYASCSLTLKDILINANRRNSFTLRLVQPVDSTECGKLNIWCQLNHNFE